MFSSLGRTAASVLGGGSGAGAGGSGSGGAANFGADDFPALGALGGGGAQGQGTGQGQGGQGSSAAVNNAAAAAAAAAAMGLPPGVGAGAGANGAEQASALAALQHQHAAREQHRQNLLGSMSGNANGNGANGSAASGQQQHMQQQHQQQGQQQPPLSAAKGGFGEPERNYATKLGAGAAAGAAGSAAWLGAAGGALPPGINIGALGGGAGAGGNTHLSGAGLNGLGGGAGRSPRPSNAVPGVLSPEAAALQQQQRAAAVAAAQAGVQRAPHEAALLAAAQAQAQHMQQAGPGGAHSGAGGAAGNSNPTGEMAQTPAQQVLLSPADRFGLVGLLSIIKMQDPDLSMLALGADLSKLGLNMASEQPLSSSFLTPWAELADGNGPQGGAPSVEPEYHLPACYNVQPPPPAQTKIANFSDETLFFVFYSAPRDVLQELAAQELYNRNWRYHKDLHLWLTKDQNTEPTQKTPQYERGNYIFFDPGPWEKITKTFTLTYESLEEKPASQAHIAQQAAAAAAHHAQQQQQARRAAHQAQQQAQQQQQQQQQQAR